MRLVPTLFALLLMPGAALPNSSETAAAPGLPPTDHGLYAIWYERMPEVMTLPYITGGQVIAQWGELETAEGQYDFSPLAAKMRVLHEQNKPFTVQVNGNLKPAWLFNRVPFLPEPLGVQVRDKRGTLMYWHPEFERAYLNFLRAYAAFLKQSPYRASLLGVRQNFNAIGTEHLQVPREKIPLTQWSVPSGSYSWEAFTPALARAYQTRVLETFVKEFSPHTRVFVRNNIKPDLRGQFGEDFKNGRLCWFQTSSEVEPRKGVSDQYQRFLDDCRTGKTLAYAEPWASAWGHHGGKTDPRWCSPPQWNYWRLLCDLHCGVSFIACYGTDLEVALNGRYRGGNLSAAEAKEATTFKDEFGAAFQFAAKYAGYQTSPKSAPGAWVAFREGDTLKGDYTFLMQRKPDRTREVKNAGPDDQRFGAWARLLPRDETMRLVLDDAFAASLATQNAELHITHLDQGTGSFDIHAAGQTFHAQSNNSGRWKTIVYELSRPDFGKDDSGAHVRLNARGSDLTLHMVAVARK